MVGEPRFFLLWAQSGLTLAKIAPTAAAQDMYNEYISRFKQRLNDVFGSPEPDGRYYETYQKFALNAARFAAAKALMVQKLLNDVDTNEADPAKREALRQNILQYYNGVYLRAEETAMLARCRTAKQWLDMRNPKHDRLFPNIRWIKSRSVTPYEPHRDFWNRVWAKDDPFWDDHQPGDHWGCKCDWIETADPITDNDFIYKPSAVKGLSGNPAKTGKVFSEEASYFKNLDAQGLKTMEGMVKTYVKGLTKEYKNTIQASGGLSVGSANFASGSLLILRRSIDDIWAHTGNIEERLSIINVDAVVKYYKYVGWKPCDTNKHPEAEYFLYYEVKIAGKTLYANVKAHKEQRREVLYCYTAKVDGLNSGEPPNIDRYKK